MQGTLTHQNNKKNFTHTQPKNKELLKTSFVNLLLDKNSTHIMQIKQHTTS